MSLEVWLDLIRQRFSPSDGQILVRSLKQDPLVWQFIQDGETNLPFFQETANDLAAFAPGKIAIWMIEQSTGISLDGLGQDDFSLPSQIKTSAAQALETTFNTGLPPTDLYSAGLMALILRERRLSKQTWQGIPEEIFVHRNQQSFLKNYYIWRTPFACLFDMISDFNDLAVELLPPTVSSTINVSLPICIHALLANPMQPTHLMELLFGSLRNLSIDFQLEGLRWLRHFHKDELSSQVAKHLIQTKKIRDLFTQVFSDLEAFEAVNPDFDPLEKRVRYSLPEDVNRLAAFYFHSGNEIKAIETYQKASDLLAFLKIQTEFQTLVADTDRIPPTRWLDVVKSIPHSKQARLYYVQALIEKQHFDVAQKHLDELPDSIEKQLLQSKVEAMDGEAINALLKAPNQTHQHNERIAQSQPGYLVHQPRSGLQSQLLKSIRYCTDLSTSVSLIENYMAVNSIDFDAVSLACDLYIKTKQYDKAIEQAAFLERIEPANLDHKRRLASLYAQTERWPDAFNFLQDLVKSESTPELTDLEHFAEAALRIDQVDMAIAICQNILEKDQNNTKALVLLGESFMAKGDVVKAIQHMENVVKLIPLEPDAWITMAWLWEKNGQNDRAIETLKQAVSQIPQQPKLLRTLGKAHLEKQAFDEALTVLKQARELDAEDTQSRLDLALAYYKSGQYQHAFDQLECYLDNYENQPEAAQILGHILVALERFDTAEPILFSAANHFPRDLETVLAAVHLGIDRIEYSVDEVSPSELNPVETLLLKAKSFHPGQDQIRLRLADIERLKGNFEKALETYTGYTKTIENGILAKDWRLNYGLGQAAIGLGNYEVGLAALQAANDIQPSNLIIRHALAEALQKSDLSGKANAMAISALKLAPQDLNNILWYAKFKNDNNEPGEAVKALKEALSINPKQVELNLWLAKSLISDGNIEEAHQRVQDLILSTNATSDLLHQASYLCVHLNDLELAVDALEKAQLNMEIIDPTLLMDLAVIYGMINEHKKALDLFDVDPSLIQQNPQIALLKADVFCYLGEYKQAYELLLPFEELLQAESEKPDHFSKSPLLYTHDLSLIGYYYRLGLLSRAVGNFDKAQHYLSAALKMHPEDITLKNALEENALVGTNINNLFETANEFLFSEHVNDPISLDKLDLICSQVEHLIRNDDIDQATECFSMLPKAGGSYPRYFAIQSQLAAHLGDSEIAEENLDEATAIFSEDYSIPQSRGLPALFRQLINLHSIAEASLALGDHLQAIDAWKKIYEKLDTQPLFNKRLLTALLEGAENQQIANTLAIINHCPGKVCLSENNFRLAETLLEKLENDFPEDEKLCMKARIISAFTGKWPLALNVDACLQGAQEASAVVMGTDDFHLADDIIESYPDDIRVLQAYGIHAFRNKRTNASHYIEKAIELDTANPINHILLANLNLEQPEQALKSLEIALSLWPDEPDWHGLAAQLNDQLGKAELAEKHIRYALEAQPENAAYWQTSAMVKAGKNDLYQAKLDLEKSTLYQPDDPNTWSKMAQINRKMGSVSEAIDNIRKAQELNPADQSLNEMELNLLFEQKNYTELEAKAREAVLRHGTDETALIFLAKALANQGRFNQALSTLNEEIEKNPDNAHLSLEYLLIKKDQNGTEAVLPELVNLAKHHPHDPQTLTTLTDWLIHTNRLDEAEEVAQKTLRILPDQAKVYLMLGRLQRIKGKLDQAISHLSQAITLEPNLIDAYIELGKTYQERRELDKAVEIFEKGSLVIPSDPRPYYHAGLALKDVKDYPGAEMMFKQAKKYSPDDANIIRQLGVVTALNLINNLREAS